MVALKCLKQQETHASKDSRSKTAPSLPHLLLFLYLQIAIALDGGSLVHCNMFTVRTMSTDYIRQPTLIFRDAGGSEVVTVTLKDGPPMPKSKILERFPYEARFMISPEQVARITSVDGFFRG
jgi:hypothetical protein